MDTGTDRWKDRRRMKQKEGCVKPGSHISFLCCATVVQQLSCCGYFVSIYAKKIGDCCAMLTTGVVEIEKFLSLQQCCTIIVRSYVVQQKLIIWEPGFR